MSDVAIRVERVTKTYKVPQDHAATIQYRISHPRSSSRYRTLRALDDVSASIDSGEFVGITGPNGCGKSTLLRLIAGVMEPDRGRIVTHGTLSPFLELGIGFKAELTARQNIFVGGALLGLSRSECAARADAVLRFAELEQFADQKLKNFSSGMGVRLAFTVAMLADADIMLMDEVLAVGDSRFREKCLEVFDAYKQMGRTIVLVSHDISSLELLCDRVLLLREGRLIGDGPPHRVIPEYRRIVASMSEPEHRPKAAAAPLKEQSEEATRWGTREVEVTGIRMLGPDGRPRHTFNASEPMAIVVDYIGNEDVAEFHCGIRVRAANGHVLAKPFTRFSEHRLHHARPGVRGAITYRMPSLSLLQGSFFVSAYLYDKQLRHAYDHVEDALEFRVADPAGRLGVIELGGSWQDVVSGASVNNGAGLELETSAVPHHGSREC